MECEWPLHLARVSNSMPRSGTVMLVLLWEIRCRYLNSDLNVSTRLWFYGSCLLGLRFYDGLSARTNLLCT